MEPPAAPQPKERVAETPSEGGLSWKETRELESLEPEIETLEGAIQEHEEKLGDPEIWTNDREVALSTQAALEAKRQERTQAMARWEELMERS